MSTAVSTIPGDKTICLPIADGVDYNQLVKDRQGFRQYLDQLIAQHPELFPSEIVQGYCFHGFRTSAKLGLVSRRIRLVSNGEAYQLRPDFVMPYMIGETEAVEKGLYLRQFGVPYEAIAYVMGKDPMYWYRASMALGRPSLVGTALKDEAAFPPHLLSDEKHTWWMGEKVYVATTVAAGCILGAELSPTAKTTDLEAAYGVFAQEAHQLAPDYQPQTVNTDGWEATQAAWKNLFPQVNLILCFLHSVMAIVQRCRSQELLLTTLLDKLWDIYHAADASEFLERLRHLQAWAIGQTLPEAILTKILNLSLKASQFILAYDFPASHRTSNMLDRLMNYQDRMLFSMQYFHGHQDSANLALRAMAMLWNFHPYGRRSQPTATDTVSPFERLNGFYYHSNWLRNFLIASSMNGRGGGKFNKHTINWKQ